MQALLETGVDEFLGWYSVALLGVAKTGVLQFAGSGTLVENGGAHFILTAAHVWDEVLRAAEKVCITLMPNQDHRCCIKRESVDNPTIIRPPAGPFGREGPDVCFIRIPPFHVGAIGIHKNFFNMGKRKSEMLAASPDLKSGHWAIMGVPEVTGVFSKSHASLVHTAYVLPQNGERTEKDHHDYLDFSMFSNPPTPSSFGGVSGGGLWQLSMESGAVKGTLEGVAFYQESKDDIIRIRCHGRHTLYHNVPSPVDSLHTKSS